MKTCSVKDCSRKSTCRGYCKTHYERWRRHGNPLTTLIAPKWSGHVRKDGYRYFWINKKTVSEHRLVMENFLGRKLQTDESVHHLDGNTLNNSIENLQVMSHGNHAKLHQTETFRNETHKQCTHCHKIKPRILFHLRTDAKNFKNRDHNLSRCAECQNLFIRKIYYKNKALLSNKVLVQSTISNIGKTPS